MIGYTFSDYAVWLLVAVTMERYVIVMWPLRASAVCVRSRALGLCACLFLVLLAANSHFAWTVGLHTELGDVTAAGDNRTSTAVGTTVTSVTACSNTPNHFTFITQVRQFSNTNVSRTCNHRNVTCNHGNHVGRTGVAVARCSSLLLTTLHITQSAQHPDRTASVVSEETASQVPGGGHGCWSP